MTTPITPSLFSANTNKFPNQLNTLILNFFAPSDPGVSPKNPHEKKALDALATPLNPFRIASLNSLYKVTPTEEIRSALQTPSTQFSIPKERFDHWFCLVQNSSYWEQIDPPFLFDSLDTTTLLKIYSLSFFYLITYCKQVVNEPLFLEKLLTKQLVQEDMQMASSAIRKNVECNPLLDTPPFAKHLTDFFSVLLPSYSLSTISHNLRVVQLRTYFYKTLLYFVPTKEAEYLHPLITLIEAETGVTFHFLLFLRALYPKNVLKEQYNLCLKELASHQKTSPNFFETMRSCLQKGYPLKEILPSFSSPLGSCLHLFATLQDLTPTPFFDEMLALLQIGLTGFDSKKFNPEFGSLLHSFVFEAGDLLFGTECFITRTAFYTEVAALLDELSQTEPLLSHEEMLEYLSFHFFNAVEPPDYIAEMTCTILYKTWWYSHLPSSLVERWIAWEGKDLFIKEKGIYLEEEVFCNVLKEKCKSRYPHLPYCTATAHAVYFKLKRLSKKKE